MAKVGNNTNCTRRSNCLAKVANESGNNQSSPDSLGTYPTWTVTLVDWYQHYWNLENSSNCQPTLWPGRKFTDQSQSSWDCINGGTQGGPLSSSGPQRTAPSISLLVGCLSVPFISEVWGYLDWTTGVPHSFRLSLCPLRKIIWSEYFTELEGNFNRYLYLCTLSVCVRACVNQFKSY